MKCPGLQLTVLRSPWVEMADREERQREGKAGSVLHVFAEECSRSGVSKKDISV
jgi:hypothetical protein